MAGTAAALVAVNGGPAMADEVLIWNGFGWSGTAQRAIHNAINDAENSASWQGPVECELIEGPVVGERFNEQTGSHWYEASVNMVCTPA